MRFTGHERDFGGPGVDDDLDYMRARYCVPSLGRFLTTDPARTGVVSSSQSWNRYTYTRGNPIKFVDPDGAESLSALRFEMDVKALSAGEMSAREFQERNRIRGQGTALALSLFIPGVDDVAFGVVARTRLGRSVASRVSSFIAKLAKVPDRALDLAREAAQGFKKFECVECAETVAGALKEQGISGQIIKVKTRQGSDFIVSDRFKEGATSITENGYHEAVRVGDTVFDNVSPDGIPADQFFKDLHSLDGLEFEIIDF